MASEFFHSPDYSIPILILLIFLSFFFLIRGILKYLANPERFHQRRIKKRLRDIDGLESSLNVSTLLKRASLEKSSLDQILAKFSLFNRIQFMMLQANLNWELRNFLVVAVLSGLVMAGLGLAKWGGWGALAGGGMGLIIPYKILVRRRKRRLKMFEQQLPDALDLLVVCVEAGQGLDAAIKRVAEDLQESSPIMSQELLLVNLEIMAGLERQQALKNLGERTGVEELVSLCNILIQSDRFGTSIAQALKTQSDYIRTDRRQRLETLANKTPVKLLFPMLLFIFPAILVVVLGPAIIGISELFGKLNR